MVLRFSIMIGNINYKNNSNHVDDNNRVDDE